MRAADPAALGAWYRDCLGLDADENGLWRQGAGPTVFATFESGTGYFGSRAQQAMLNFRVRDLDAMLAQLRAMGADVAKETQEMEGVGRFGWVTDPEGNRVELWQPACNRVFTQAVTCWWPNKLPRREPWPGPRGSGPGPPPGNLAHRRAVDRLAGGAPGLRLPGRRARARWPVWVRRR